MKPIVYLKGDATSPQAKGVKIIAHVNNDLGGWGKGLVLAISRRWPGPEREFRAWHRERAQNDFGLGATQFVQVEEYIWVANMVGQHGKTAAKATPALRPCATAPSSSAWAPWLLKPANWARAFICRASAAVWRVANGA